MKRFALIAVVIALLGGSGARAQTASAAEDTFAREYDVIQRRSYCSQHLCMIGRTGEETRDHGRDHPNLDDHPPFNSPFHDPLGRQALSRLQILITL